MPWNYDVSTLATSAKDQVRFLTGDVLASDPQMEDEEINFALTQRPTIFGAAAVCCRALATKYARSADQKAGDTSVAYSQIAKAYSLKAAELEAAATTSGGAPPFSGGLSGADMAARAGNTDLMPPQFNIGMMDSTLPVPAVGNESAQDVGPHSPLRP